MKFVALLVIVVAILIGCESRRAVVKETLLSAEGGPVCMTMISSSAFYYGHQQEDVSRKLTAVTDTLRAGGLEIVKINTLYVEKWLVRVEVFYRPISGC